MSSDPASSRLLGAAQREAVATQPPQDNAHDLLSVAAELKQLRGQFEDHEARLSKVEKEFRSERDGTALAIEHLVGVVAGMQAAVSGVAELMKRLADYWGVDAQAGGDRGGG